MARAHFLLCLPARLGVLLFSLSEFVVTGFLAALLWIAFAHNEQNQDNRWSKQLLVGVLTLASVSTITAIISFAGFVGAIFKWASGVRAFARTIAWLLGIQVVSSVLYIIMIYVEPKSDFIKQCENGSTNSSVVNTCTNEIQEVRGITVGIVVLGLLVHAYEVYVVAAYASELEDARYSAVPIREESKPYAGRSFMDRARAYGRRGGSWA